MVRSRDTDSRSGLNNGGPLDAKCGSPIIERAIHWANKLVNKAGTPGKKQIRSPSSPPSGVAFGVFFVFIFLKNVFTEIYFRLNILQICTPTAQPVDGRGPAANWPGGRDLNINKKIYICMEVLGGDLPPPCRAAGPLPPLQLAARGRQALSPRKITSVSHLMWF